MTKPLNCQLPFKWLLFILLIFPFISACQNNHHATHQKALPSSINGKVIKYGRFKPIRKGHILNHQQSSSGKLIKGATLELTEQTENIPIEENGYFGFQYRLSNIPEKFRTLELRRVLIHPKMLLPNGTAKTGSDYIIRVPVKSGNVFDLIGYSFSEKYEQVPGNWIFQLWHKNKLLLQQTFIVHENT